MKTVYKKISIGSRNFVLTISLLVSLIAMASGEAASGTVNVESLDGLQVSLVSPNVSGAEKLTTDDTKAHYYAGSDNDLVCHLNNLTAGTHRLTVKVTLGTNTYVLAVVDIVVAANADGETATDSMNLTAVKSFGDGSGGGDVPACYGVDGDDDAHITTPLSVGGAVASGSGAVASGQTAGEGSQINASGEGAVASGYADGVGSQINASGEGAVASGQAGEFSQINASGHGATASGYTEEESAKVNASGHGATASGYAYYGAQVNASGHGTTASGCAQENAQITASGHGATASGYAQESAQITASGRGATASGYAYEGYRVTASSIGAVACGYADSTNGNVEATGDGSQAFGIGTKATQAAQMAVGQCNVPDSGGLYQFIVGNGADDANRHNAFAVTKAGELALFKADGTPVTLSVAQLEALIAQIPSA